MTEARSQAQRRADRLSFWQKEALEHAAQCKGGEYWTPYQRYFTRAHRDLVQGGVLTPLGLEVRRILQEQNK